MLLNDLNNVELRRRYLAVRTAGLSLADNDQVRFPLVKLVLSFALLAVFGLFGKFISQWSSAPEWQTQLFQLLLFVALCSWQWGEVRRLTLRRKHGSQFGPLPPDCPLDETEIRRRFLGE
jgi:hypothetical protein